MHIREALGRHQALSVVVALGAVVIAVYLIMTPAAPGVVGPAAPSGQYFYDLGTQSVFVAPVGVLPPIAPPSGANQANGAPGGVRAVVYACGDCAIEAERKVAYLETFTPAAKASLERELQGATTTLGEYQEHQASGHLVARPAARPAWVIASSDQGQAIADVSGLCSAPQTFTSCKP